MYGIYSEYASMSDDANMSDDAKSLSYISDVNQSLPETQPKVVDHAITDVMASANYTSPIFQAAGYSW